MFLWRRTRKTIRRDDIRLFNDGRFSVLQMGTATLRGQSRLDTLGQLVDFDVVLLSRLAAGQSGRFAAPHGTGHVVLPNN
jgi:hypothetical protein